LQDFTIGLRYRHAHGVGDILMCPKGALTPEGTYHLMLRNDGIVLVRETRAGRQERRATSRVPPPSKISGPTPKRGRGPEALQPGKWYDLVIQRAGGQFRVLVDGKQALAVADPGRSAVHLVAFGSLVGDGFGFDDISVASAAAPRADVTPRVADRLQGAGIRTADDLVQRLQSRQGLLALCRQANLPVDRVLFHAQELEMARALGASNVTRAEIILLRRLGLRRPEDLRKFKGRTKLLRDLLLERGSSQGIKPPSLQKVAQWVAAASKQVSRLPAPRVLTPHRLTAKDPPAPHRLLSLGGRSDAILVKAILKELGGPGVAKTLPGGGPALWDTGGAGFPHVFTIKPPQKTYHYEFEAKKLGLYRADISLKRPHGDVDLDWSVQRPHYIATPKKHLGIGKPWMGKLKVKYSPVISGKPFHVTSGEGDFYAYFLLRGKDIPASGRLRLQLRVLKNVDAGYVKKTWKPDPIEGTTTPPSWVKTPPSPTIQGMIRVLRRGRPVQYNTTVSVPFRDKKNPKLVVNDPVVLLEAPVCSRDPSAYQQPPKSGPAVTSAGQLDVRFDPKPRPWKWGMKTEALYFMPRWHIEVLRDGELITGKRNWWKGFSEFHHVNPKTGAYSVLVSPKGPLFMKKTSYESPSIEPKDPLSTHTGADCPNVKTLTTTGLVFDRRFPSFAYGGRDRIDVALTTRGGEAYVVELAGLWVSDQAEAGNDDNDDGLGEFNIRATTFLAQDPETLDDLKAMLKQMKEPKRQAVSYPKYEYARIPGNVLFPGLLVGWWPTKELYAAGYTGQGPKQPTQGLPYNSLGVIVHVIEDDQLTWWQENKAAVLFMLEYVKACVGAAFSGGASAFGGVKAVLTLAAKTANDMRNLAGSGIGAADDFLGWPSLVTWTKYDYGLQKQETFVFKMASGSNANDADSAICKGKMDPYDPSEQEQDRGYVSKLTTGSHNVKAFVQVRRAPALYSAAHYRVTGFTLGANMDQTARTHGRTLYPETYDDISDIYFTTVGKVLHQLPPGSPGPPYTIPEKSLTYPIKTKKKPFAPVSIPAPPWVSEWVLKQEGYKAQPASYCEFAFWDEDPGFDPEFVGVLSHTFYHEDFRQYAPKKGTTFTQTTKNKTTGQVQTKAEYRYLGLVGGHHRYRGDFTFYEPGGYLSEVKIRAYVSIREE